MRQTLAFCNERNAQHANRRTYFPSGSSTLVLIDARRRVQHDNDRPIYDDELEGADKHLSAMRCTLKSFPNKQACGGNIDDGQTIWVVEALRGWELQKL